MFENTTLKSHRKIGALKQYREKGSEKRYSEFPSPPGPIRVSGYRAIEVGGVSAVTHLLFVAASVLSGNPRLRRSSQASTSPFTAQQGARFIPAPALHQGRPGEHPIIVTRYRPGIVSAPPHRLSPATLRGTPPPCGWSFLRTFVL